MLIFTIKMFIMLYFITKKIKRKVCFSIILNLFRTNKKYPDTQKCIRVFCLYLLLFVFAAVLI